MHCLISRCGRCPLVYFWSILFDDRNFGSLIDLLCHPRVFFGILFCPCARLLMVPCHVTSCLDKTQLSCWQGQFIISMLTVKYVLFLFWFLKISRLELLMCPLVLACNSKWSGIQHIDCCPSDTRADGRDTAKIQEGTLPVKALPAYPSVTAWQAMKSIHPDKKIVTLTNKHALYSTCLLAWRHTFSTMLPSCNTLWSIWWVGHGKRIARKSNYVSRKASKYACRHSTRYKQLRLDTQQSKFSKETAADKTSIDCISVSELTGHNCG